MRNELTCWRYDLDLSESIGNFDMEIRKLLWNIEPGDRVVFFLLWDFGLKDGYFG